MVWVRRLVILMAVVSAGYMVFDGMHALILGDYLTPKIGRGAGKLGLWAGIVEAAGIPPRSLLMKGIFIVYGGLWLVVVYRYIRGARWGRAEMLILVVGSVWYVGAQTALAFAQIVLLILLPPNSREPAP